MQIRVDNSIRAKSVGYCLERFPDDKHLAKWVGLCPGNNQTGGKPKSGRTTKGNRPGLVPAHTANPWMKYRFDRDSKLAGLGLGGGVRYIGNLYGEDANQYLSPSVTLFDASVSYDLGQYRLSVNASNLFDKEYVSSCTGTYYCYWGNGRTVIGNLAYRW